MQWQRFVCLLGILLMACQTAPETAESPPVLPTPTLLATRSPQPDETLIQLTAVFRALRAAPSHFAGGEWNDNVDQWQGRKHRVMLSLQEKLVQEQLGGATLSRAALVDLLDTPDHIVDKDDPLFALIERLPSYDDFAASEEFLVYEWRGTHDFLFFAIQNEQIIGSDWWYSGE